MSSMFLQTDNGGGVNQRNYAYDAYGNAAVSGNTGTFPMSPLTPGAGTTFTNNQLPSSLATYDAAGNAIGLGSCTNCLAYDAENRQVAAALNGGTTSYGYDGAGNRVLKTTADGTVTVYVYDALNQLIAEYTSAAVAPAAPCQTCYLSWDQLGSTRLVTDAGGNVIARHDYLPFGEEIGAGNAGRPSGWGALDAVDQKFTGQERDDESHLDFFEARYYGSAQARFNSPDPMNAGADLYNPQSWNGYAYVMNTPLSAVDPDGLADCGVSPCAAGTGSTSQGEQATTGGGSLGFSGGFTLGGSYAEPKRIQTIRAPYLPHGSDLVDPFIGAGKQAISDTVGTLSFLANGNNPTEATLDFLWWLRPSTQRQRAGASGLQVYFAMSLGSGPAAGILEISDAYGSVKAVQHYAGKGVEYVFDSESQRFVMGSMKHSELVRRSGIVVSKGTVGGNNTSRWFRASN